MKKITLELNEKEVAMVQKFTTKQYPSAKDNVGTSFPAIHVVEKREWSTPLAYGYGGETQYGYDGETYYNLEDLKKDVIEEHCQTKEEIEKDGYDDNYLSEEEVLEAYDEGDLNELLEDFTCEEVTKYEVTEVWKAVAYFFIREEAEEYLKYQAHNLGKARIYTHSTGYNNKGSMKTLGNLIMKIGNKTMEE